MIVLPVFYILWSIRIIANVLSFIQLWYVKEYRFDRMFIHLKTPQGKRLLFLPFKRPPMSVKALFLFGVTVCTSILVILFSPFPLYLTFFILDVGCFVFIALLVALLKLPTHLLHTYKIKKSVALLRKHASMNVIGITGSYGKTSTKEFVSTILSTEYETLKTQASKNSPIGIAELILSSLMPNHQMFVVEMGAYKKGEIAEMCAMVRPEIGIVTAINPQHQDLFGSIERTIEAKYELVSNLVGKRIVVINADNSYTKQMGVRAKSEGCSVIFYSVHSKKTEWYATDIEQLSDTISFVAHFGAKSARLKASLLGVYQVSNILAALAAAVAAGMPFEIATKAVNALVPFNKTMQPVSTSIPAQCIDDTFNNNPDAAIAALHYLKTRKGKKILVFQPMIELGNYAGESHRNVGAVAASICNEIILTNDNYLNYFQEGVQSKKDTTTVQVLSAKEAALFIRSHTSTGDTVLFKGKEAANVLSELK